MNANEKTPLLWKPFNWSFLIAAFLMLLLQQCKKKPVVEIKSRVKAIHGIAFIDVNDAVPTNVSNVKVTLIDPEKKVLSSNGIAFERLEITGGVMSIGLSPKAEFSAQRPYRFSIRAEAEGYMTNIRSIVITDSTPNYIPIYMAKLDSLPPSGLAASAGNITTVSGGVFTQDQVLSATLPNTNVSPLIIKISKGIQLLYGDKPVKTKDTLSFRLLFGIPRDTNANRVFPGGFEVTDAIDQTGKRIADAANPVFFTTAGWFSMEMNTGKTVVTGFSQPIDVEIPIGDTVINPTTQKAVKAGDKIPFWSLDNRTGTWRLESNAEIIASNSGGLKANIKINHLSTFNLDYPGTTCPSPMNVIFSPLDFSGDHFTQYINTADNSIIKSKIVNFITSPLDLLLVPMNITGKLYVHEGTDITSTGRGISDALNCISSPTGNLHLLGTPSFLCVKLEFLKQSDGLPICPNNIWLEPGPSSTYSTHSGILKAGTVNIPRIPQTGPLGIQTVKLWYVAMGNPIELSIGINFDADGQAQIIKNPGGLHPDLAEVVITVTSNPMPPSCERLIQVTLPTSLIAGLNCN